MADAQKAEAAKLATQKAGDKSGSEMLFPVNLAQLQVRNLAVLSEANEIILETAKAVWEKQAELLKIGSEKAGESMKLAKKETDNPNLAFSQLAEEWHQNGEKTVSRLRAINDLMRDCEWRLVSLYLDGLTSGHSPIFG